MNRYTRIALISGVALTGSWIAFGPGIAQKTASTPPIARYVMNVSTTTGMAGMQGGASSAISMMMGGGASNREMHTVELRLGSRNAATPGAPKADHFPPDAARMGKALPLITPTGGTSETPPQSYERPKGRLLLYWGCGAKAGPGQPVIIDFAKLAAGQMPPNLFSTRVPVDYGPSSSNSKTFGHWPNAKGGQQPGKGSSLLGEHRIAGNYTPEIKFSLAQDYMPGIVGRASEQAGATNISWNAVTGATGYYAWAVGAKSDGGNSGDFVWWSSSATREFGGGLWDWLPPETVRRLITEKVVMPPTQTSCTIPAEVKAAASGFLMSNLNAYGPEANFAYPPRPANAATPWKLEWTTRVRFRSTTMWMIGGPDMGEMSAATDDSGEAQPQKKCKKKRGLGGALGGVIGGALGVGDGC